MLSYLFIKNLFYFSISNIKKIDLYFILINFSFLLIDFQTGTREIYFISGVFNTIYFLNYFSKTIIIFIILILNSSLIQQSLNHVALNILKFDYLDYSNTNIPKFKLGNDYELPIIYIEKLYMKNNKIINISNTRFLDNIYKNYNFTFLPIWIDDNVTFYKKDIKNVAESIFDFNPEYIILQDTNHGVNAAINSCANYYIVKNYTELNLSIIKNKVIKMNKIKPIPKYDDLNILIPMAGAGSRFFQAGYTFPKPLISIKNLTMIEVVLKSLNIDGNFIFIVRKEDIEKYNINYFLKNLKKKCNIVILDKITEGAACSALIAKKYINNKNPLIIANSDQYIEWDPIDFMYKLNNSKDISGGILTFKSNHPKWSYVKVNKNLLVTKTVEKKPISDRATVGVYFWSKGSDFVESAEEMIMKNDRTNNEFYICPSFNYLIKKKKKIIEYKIDEMWGLGTPEDLRYFIDNKLEDISEWFD